MVCMKCGRTTADGQVFCDSCLQVMDTCPVKPGTHIHLPHPKTPAAAKKQSHRKRVLSPEEQIAMLRKSLRRMHICAAILVVVLCLATAMLLHEVLGVQAPVIGQNYTIDTTQQTD